MNIPNERKVDPPLNELANLGFKLRPYVRQTGCGWRSPWLLKDRKILDYLLVFIPQGKGIFKIGDQEFHVESGDLIWIPPDTIHRMQGTSERMNCIYIHFDLSYDPNRSHWDAFIPDGTIDLSKCASAIHPKIKEPIINCLTGKVPIQNKAKLSELMMDICHEHSKYGNRAFLKLSGLMILLLDLIIHDYWLHSKNKKNNNSLNKIKAAALFIQERVREDLNIALLAKRFGISESHFRKLFRETYGESSRTFHRKARMNKACELLVYTNMNISEIADFLGFSSIYNFSRAFKNIIGSSPSSYR